MKGMRTVLMALVAMGFLVNNSIFGVCSQCDCKGQQVNQYYLSGNKKISCGSSTVRNLLTNELYTKPADIKSNCGQKCTNCTCSTGRIADHNYADKDGIPCNSAALEQMTDSSCLVSSENNITSQNCN